MQDDISCNNSTLIPLLGFASNESVPFLIKNFYIRRIV